MFLACGDALFDLFAAASEDASAIQLHGRIGGSPLNVAMGLARLGQNTAYFTKISTDLFGQRMMAHLAKEGIDSGLILRSEQNSTLAIVELNDEGVPSYAFYTDNTADRSIEISELPQQLPEAIKAIHLGSYTTATEPTASSLVSLVKREAARRFISYDPNVRLAIEPSKDLWRARIQSLIGTAHLMKASDEDLALLYPGRDLADIAGQWLAAGVKLAVITRGGEGAIGFTAKGVKAEVPGKKIAVIDTVGAGDTFQAGLLAGLAQNQSLEAEKVENLSQNALERLLDFAASAAAITCSRRGADLPRLGEIQLPQF